MSHHRILECLLVSTLLVLGACNDGSSSRRNAAAPPAAAPPVNDVPAPKPQPTIPAPKVALTAYTAANRCIAFKTEDNRYLQQVDGGYRASLILADTDPQSYSFYLKPTGAYRAATESATAAVNYLLLSDYRRQAAPEIRGKVTNVDPGSKTLLGISDPQRRFLDFEGNFIGQPGEVIAGVGDMSDFATDAAKIINSDSANNDGADQINENSSVLGDGLDSLGTQLEDGLAQVGNSSPALGTVDEASDLAVWELSQVAADSKLFTLRSAVTGQYLVVTEDGALGLAQSADSGHRFELERLASCATYPEAQLNAERVDPNVAPRIYWDEDNKQDVYGWVDDHAHITAYEFIGGRINYGSTHHKFGVDHALGNCQVNHGPNGSTGTVEMATSDDFNGHETVGWPSYNDWPRSNSLQHHQTYYRWMERAFLSGQKIMVNLITHNELLCQIVPQKKNDCDVMADTRLQAQRTYELQDYIDMQSGGPGKGWFRVVGSPAEARQVIDAGKMAVVLGIEVSKVLNCGEFMDEAECTRAQIEERLDEVYDLGVRLIFPVHKFDNAFGGHLPHSGFALGPILSVGNQAETGHPLEVEACGDDSDPDSTGLEENANDPRNFPPVGIVDYLLANFEYLVNQLPPSGQSFDPRTGTDHLCNIRGLTPLGEFLLDRLVERGMMIDLDHISRRASETAMNHLAQYKDAQNRVFPVISSHDWTDSQALLNRIGRDGGFIGRFARDGRNNWLERLTGMAARYDNQPFFGGGIASDVNGIANLPKDPRTNASVTDGEIDYEQGFLSYDGRVRFKRQVTGDRVFDLYAERGVAHYGLYPDYIADAQQFGHCNAVDQAKANADSTSLACRPTTQALDVFFRSAEAYLRMWERAASFRSVTTN